MADSFSQKLTAFFACDRGTYSIVTSDEFKKSQITFTGPEQELVEAFFGVVLDGHHGSIPHIKLQGISPELEFRIFPTGERKNITVSYKTNRPNELRFYCRKNVFKPAAGEYWCVFVRQNEIWLGALSEWFLDALEIGVIPPNPRSKIIEPEEDDYQALINGSIPSQVVSTTKGWKRNPKIAALAIQAKNFTCELFPRYPSFISKATNVTFVEAHHLIPMSLQGKFGKINLDNQENICSLSPFAHRMIHHAKFDVIESHLDKLIDSRRHLLDQLGLNRFDVLEMYL